MEHVETGSSGRGLPLTAIVVLAVLAAVTVLFAWPG